VQVHTVRVLSRSPSVADVVFVLLTIASFALVVAVVKGVARL
jgi:hypothetical protein